jgi:hypothetical protein
VYLLTTSLWPSSLEKSKYYPFALSSRLIRSVQSSILQEVVTVAYHSQISISHHGLRTQKFRRFARTEQGCWKLLVAEGDMAGMNPLWEKVSQDSRFH